MDRAPQGPLTTAEAKARLRAAAQNVTIGAWPTQGRWPLLIAAAAGFVAGRLRLPTLLGSALCRRAAPMLLSMLLTRKKADQNSAAPPP